MPGGDQFLLELQVVLDDAVVDDDRASGVVAVRVGVFLGGPAVRGPAGVADAVFAGERFGGERVFQAAELAGAAPDFDAAVVDDRDAGGIVSAVFEAAQTLDQNRHDLFRADVPDDPAHD